MTDQTSSMASAYSLHEQDQCVADRLVRARQLLLTAQSDPVISSRLAEAGYPAARLEEGLKLYKAAQVALISRQAALSKLKHVTEAFATVETTARQVYTDFRGVARLLFHDGVTRIHLGLEGSPPKDLEKFMLTARSVYDTALRTPKYRRKLAQYGSLDSACASLDELEATYAAFRTAQDAALRATQRWDRVMVSLDDWVHRFCKTAKRVLRDRPELKYKIGL